MKKNIYFPPIFSLLTLAIGYITSGLDTTVMNIAVVGIKNSFNISVEGMVWIIDAYVLTFGSFLILCGSLGAKYGAKFIYCIGLAFFTLSSYGCSLSTSATMLIIMRALQGFGASLFVPSSLALLMGAYKEPKQKAKAIGIWATVVSAVAWFGPLIGGFLLQYFGWQSIFILNIPLGIIGISLAIFIIRTEEIKQSGLKINLISHLSFILSIASAIFYLIEGKVFGWFSHKMLFFVILFLVCLIFFISRERKEYSSIIPKSLFKNKNYIFSNIIGSLLNIGIYGGLFFFGVYFQEQTHLNSLRAGIFLLPMVLTFVFGNIIFTGLTHKLSSDKILYFFLTVSTACILFIYFLTFFVTPIPYSVLSVTFFVSNVCIGIVVPAMMSIVMHSAENKYSSIAGASLNTNRQVGSLFGVAIMGIIISNNLDNWQKSLQISLLVILVSYILSLILGKKITNILEAKMQHNEKILFSEFKNDKIKIKNRFVMPPMATYSSLNGIPSDRFIEHYVKRAENGVGLIITEAVAINHPTASTDANSPNMWNHEASAKWEKLIKKVHSYNTLIIPQLWHCGASRKLSHGRTKEHATALSFGATSPSGLYGDQSTIGLPATVSELEEIIYKFADAALNAKKLGFDGIEIHGAHSQLIDNFFCCSTNKRSDEYGFHSRTLFAEKIIKQCRSVVGDNFPILFRFSNWQLWNPLEKNFDTPQELEQFLLPLINAGVDIFDCSSKFFYEQAFEDHEGSLAFWTKKITNLPIIAVGGVSLSNNFIDSFSGESAEYKNNIADLEKCLLNNEFDLIAVGRGLLHDYTLINKIRENKIGLDEINLLDILNKQKI